MTAAQNRRDLHRRNDGQTSNDDVSRSTPARPAVPRSRVGGLWVAAVAFALLLPGSAAGPCVTPAPLPSSQDGSVMLTTAQRATMVSSSPPSEPRLLLATTRAGQAILDGGWWPRSWDPVAELPGLVVALAARYGPIRYVMLNSVTWDSRFRKLAVADAVVRMGWFTSVDPALLIATTDRGDQLDLLVVPPQTAAATAERAMTTAADPTNMMRAPDVLAAAPAAPENGPDPEAAWDNEGGHTSAGGPYRSTDELSTAHSS